MFAVPHSWPIIVNNANLMALAKNMLIEGSFAPIFPIKIDTCGRCINENVSDVLKSFVALGADYFTFGGNYFPSAANLYPLMNQGKKSHG